MLLVLLLHIFNFSSLQPLHATHHTFVFMCACSSIVYKLTFGFDLYHIIKVLSNNHQQWPRHLNILTFTKKKVIQTYPNSPSPRLWWGFLKPIFAFWSTMKTCAKNLCDSCMQLALQLTNKNLTWKALETYN